MKRPRYAVPPTILLAAMSEFGFAATPEPPYYAVVFSSTRTARDAQAYADEAERMLQLAACQDGFLGVESVRDAHGAGITVSYWRDPDAIEAWRRHAEHTAAREHGRRTWYRHYQVRIARVERAYAGPLDSGYR